ncbi:hypothetical protein EX353_13045 [Klebsiella pneumoniae]|uniref:Uncharacterized protein n=1 Tax=Klebsiella pneumoniae TaxID=573 RepID=A0AAW9UXX8_KLEPN|nr:hypothetical protein [Klebsiella pneumoniae]MSS31964.1 hypothetical protein [Klebsiella pneumoniae]PAU42050.1 hypothetical protein CKF46_20115 [Klebsiella pneumoniae]QBE72817.1 hypothetical protein EXC92_13910 [Klebsiella pneumoniae]QBG01970.1 hypothetical protein EX353_13045 [Klebsiella pneumoniae]
MLYSSFFKLQVRCRCFLGRMFGLRDSPLRDSPFQGQRERGAKWLTVLSCSMKSIEYRITRQQKASAGFFRFLRVC